MGLKEYMQSRVEKKREREIARYEQKAERHKHVDRLYKLKKQEDLYRKKEDYQPRSKKKTLGGFFGEDKRSPLIRKEPKGIRREGMGISSTQTGITRGFGSGFGSGGGTFSSSAFSQPKRRKKKSRGIFDI